jgi:hypothetical protein
MRWPVFSTHPRGRLAATRLFRSQTPTLPAARAEARVQVGRVGRVVRRAWRVRVVRPVRPLVAREEPPAGARVAVRAVAYRARAVLIQVARPRAAGTEAAVARRAPILRRAVVPKAVAVRSVRQCRSVGRPLV